MNKSLALFITLVGMIAVSALSTAFLLAWKTDFRSDINGLFCRWIYFSWRYCLPAGIGPAIVFLVAYWRDIFR